MPVQAQRRRRAAVLRQCAVLCGECDMTDKERILSAIISSVANCSNIGKQGNDGVRRDHRGEPYPQFAPERGGGLCPFGDYGVAAKTGDIVLCRTTRNGPWKVSVWVEDFRGGGSAHSCVLLREIGSKRLCRMSNEGYSVLVGVEPSLLYEGAKRRVHRYATKAFSERYGGDYFVRCGGVEFDGATLKIWVRPHAWMGARHEDEGLSVAIPYCVDMKWNSKTRIKDIQAALREAGWPNRKFEYAAKEAE